MSTPVMTWSPDYTSQGSHAPRVFGISFGDGYMQRAPNGLNPDLPTWDLTWTTDATTAASIITFLKTQGGVTAFLWQGPEDSIQTLWICRKYGSQPSNYNKTIVTATFEQVVS